MGDKILIKYLLLGLLAAAGTSSLKLRCPLVWKPYQLGAPLPSNVIYSGVVQLKAVTVITGFNTADKPVIGHYITKSGAFIAEGNTVLENPSPMEILVNEYDCDVSWQAPGTNSKSFFTSIGDTYVGKKDNYAGAVDTDLKSVVFVGSNKKVQNSQSFEVLISTTAHVNLEYLDIEFQSAIKGELDFVGMDEMNNMGYGSTISQTLEHSKSITEVSSFTSERSWGSSNSISIDVKVSVEMGIGGMSLPISGDVSVGGGWSSENEESVSESIGRENQKTIVFGRTITLPPSRHIQACTLIGVAENFSSAYTSTGKYTIKGWSGTEIKDYLLNTNGCPPSELKVGSDYATCIERGHFEGSFHSASLLVVVDKLDTYNCSALEHNIYKLQQLKRNGITKYNEPEMLKLRNYVQEMLSPKIMLSNL